jgi:hypothetical protein
MHNFDILTQLNLPVNDNGIVLIGDSNIDKTEIPHYKPVIFRGKVVKDYYVSPKGFIISAKQGVLRTLSASGCGCKYNPYPKVSLSFEDKTKKTLMVHRLVCETYHKKPMPKELKDLNWNRIPAKERKILEDFVTHADRYQVNHIDHDHGNFHPSNLEWVTVKENQQKYQEHKLKTT